MCTSSAYEVDETPYMCLTMKWDPSWMGIASTKVYTIVSSSGGIQNSRQLPKAWLLIVTVKQKRLI